MLSLLFHTAAKFKDGCGETRLNDANKKLEQMFSLVKKNLTDYWIIRHFTQAFGDPYPHRSKYARADEDIKVKSTLVYTYHTTKFT